MFQFLYGFLAALIIPIAALFAAGFFGLISPIKPLVVQSGSMEPTIKTGSVVFIQKSSVYKPNEVIAFTPEGQKNLITHRIVSGQNIFHTKGDANEEADSWQVKKDQIAGKAILYIPNLGFGVDFVKHPQGFVLLVIIPAAIIIWEELKILLGEISKFFLRARMLKLSSGSPKLMIIAPLVGFFSLVVAVSGAFFLDNDKSLGNILGASDSFASTQTLVINEFLWDSGCGSNASQEALNYWIELYNGGASTVNLKDWRFTDASSNTIQISNANKFVASGAYIVLTKDGSVFTQCYTLQGTPETANLGGNDDFLPSSTGGVIRLEQPDGVGGFNIIDRVEYGPTQNAGVLNAPEDQSIARIPNGTDSAGGDTFAAGDFIVISSPSPGVSN